MCRGGLAPQRGWDDKQRGAEVVVRGGRAIVIEKEAHCRRGTQTFSIITNKGLRGLTKWRR